MEKRHPLISCTAEEFKEKHLGKIGTPKRDKFEKEVAEEILKEQVDKIFTKLYNNHTDGKQWDKAKRAILKLIKVAPTPKQAIEIKGTTTISNKEITIAYYQAKNKEGRTS